MTREQARKAAEVMLAYANGEEVETMFLDGQFRTTENPVFNFGASEYRIKPKLTHRPFKTKEECWNEMQKHQPFGWIKVDDVYVSIVCIHADNRIELNPQRMFISFERAFNEYLFADGTPFGIEEVNK